MSTTVYTKCTVTKPQVFSMIENATQDLLNAAGELSRFEWTTSTSTIVDGVLSIASQVAELRRLHDEEQPVALPANVIIFRGRAS